MNGQIKGMIAEGKFERDGKGKDDDKWTDGKSDKRKDAASEGVMKRWIR